MTILRSLRFGFAKTHSHIALFVILFVLYSERAGAQNAFADSFDLFSIFPYSSASHARDDFSHFINPAFLDLPGSTAVGYLHTISRDEGTVTRHLSLTAFGFGIAWSQFQVHRFSNGEVASQIQSDIFTIGKGFFIGNSLGFGLAYQWGNRDPLEEYRSWTCGIVVRPLKLLSFGFASHHLGDAIFAKRAIPRKDVYSIAVRPWKNYLTVSVDASVRKTNGWDDAEFLYTAEITPFSNISLFCSFKPNDQFSFGISIPFDSFMKDGKSVIVTRYDLTTSHHNQLHTIGVALAESRYRTHCGALTEILHIPIVGTINEIPVRQRMKESSPVFSDIIAAIHSATTVPTIKAIALTIDANSLGFARIQELREELLRFKRHGGKVFAILMSSGNKNYYLASVADRIYFNPAESFLLNGLTAHVYFLGELLDKIGIKFESVRKGKYKFFNEPFTNRVMSEEYRNSLIELLTNLNETFLSDISAARNIAPSSIREMFRYAIITGREARERGFVDELAYPSEALKEISHRIGKCRTVSLRDYLSREYRDAQWGPLPEIAVIHVEGNIVHGKIEKSGFIEREITGDENYREYLTEALENPLVKGIVVRINSGGGSAVASDLMLHYLKASKQKYKKPIAFSFGDIAASGGYYIACSNDTIFASPATITGSIGVVGGKVSLQKLYEKIGINKEVVKLEEFADIFTESRNMTPKEREIFQKTIDTIYDRFVSVVSEGRKIEKAKIPNIAEGRVFTGTQSKENKLIDEIGNIMRAIEYVRIRAGITGEYAIRHIPQKKTPLVAELFSMATVDANLPEFFKNAIADVDKWEFLYSRNEAALYLFPYKIIIE
ncbi:MAG: signal peptide peptidase SppA [Spirochaetes bacterium]|nr:signal peptide peptidase SppA [Spirochaetota bacterium]